MILNRLEVLADAIAYNNQAHEPGSSAYQNRNPGNLTAFSLKHLRDEQSRRIFTSILDGYQALLFDLKVKCSGQSRANMPDNPTITDLMKSYGHAVGVARTIAKRVRKALNIDVTADTPLTFFLEQ